MLLERKRAKVDGSELLTDVTTTIKTFVKTRDARGILGVAQLAARYAARCPIAGDHVIDTRRFDELVYRRQFNGICTSRRKAPRTRIKTARG
jgi:hypothetical protein